MIKYTQNNLEQLEAESIHILREVVAEFENPVMLYSVGKDSSVMLRLAQKAFFPGPIPFKLLHVDTTFKFKEMYEFRDRMVKEVGARLEIFTLQEGLDQGANPLDWGTQKCCAVMKTQALLEALRQGEYDAAIGGARRDEEKSRAKERVFSFRDQHGQWDPKRQRPELWNLYNARHNPGESIRIFPLSNWTELDVWHYILREKIPVVPLYFARERPVIERDGMLILDDDRFRLLPGEAAQMLKCRFRSLGCVPCTGAIRSDVDSLEGIIEELVSVRNSERATRTIDHDVEGSMEDKKREGYF
ncbi:MAG: sulfate adenylyltransferase subunit CysD [Planctomycetes bacterium]|nr:sulfate adenylyltransferase subunit CysD [Planctomycetota bacterium]